MIIVPARRRMHDGWDEIQYLMSIINMNIRRGLKFQLIAAKAAAAARQVYRTSPNGGVINHLKRGAYTESIGISPESTKFAKLTTQS